MAPRERRTSLIVRWGWLAMTIALVIALLANAVGNRRAARDAVATLNRGQADILRGAVRIATFRNRDLTAEELEALVAEHADQGLRYLAVIDDEGRVLMSAGTPAGGVVPRLRRFGPDVLDARAGAMQFAMPLGRPGGREPRLIVVQFEPVVASRLVARADRSVALALIGAAGLLAAAAVLWRMSRRYEEAERRMEENRRLSLLGEMSAVLAHEIRNPLASLKGNAQLLAERLEPGTSDRRRADRVVAEAARLEALTTDLLDFARSGPLDVRPVDPAELVRAAADEVGAGAIGIDTRDAPERWPLDPTRFRQVLTNLLRNAWQASPPDRPPVVRVARENDELVITVRDFGPGLPAQDRDRIFDPFFTTRTNGTGLGLPVARRIVELHGGRITAEDAPDGGAVFSVRLPAGSE
ncbi:MAG: ATP-binding protein [bacterium]|jgi:two-component system sensor histidine kinase HydH|nr:MAG: two-component sensor histidine kinase [bacterium]